jgi:hypothetical protein
MGFKKHNCTSEEAAAIVATIHDYDFQPEDVDQVLFVVQRNCPYCGEPHIITVTGTTDSPEETIDILAAGISRVLMERELSCMT